MQNLKILTLLLFLSVLLLELFQSIFHTKLTLTVNPTLTADSNPKFDTVIETKQDSLGGSILLVKTHSAKESIFLRLAHVHWSPALHLGLQEMILFRLLPGARLRAIHIPNGGDSPGIPILPCSHSRIPKVRTFKEWKRLWETEKDCKQQQDNDERDRERKTTSSAREQRCVPIDWLIDWLIEWLSDLLISFYYSFNFKMTMMMIMTTTTISLLFC